MFEHEIKQSVTMRDVLSRYGIALNNKGKAVCPFHSDANPSMSVYSNDKKWTCFVCNEGGDVIDFASRYFGLDHKGTVERINSDFCLNLPIKAKESDRQRAARLAEMRRREAERKRHNDMVDSVKSYYWDIFDLWKYYSERAKKLKPGFLEAPSDKWFDAITKAQHYSTELDYADILLRNTQNGGEPP